MVTNDVPVAGTITRYRVWRSRLNTKPSPKFHQPVWFPTLQEAVWCALGWEDMLSGYVAYIDEVQVTVPSGFEVSSRPMDRGEWIVKGLS